MAKKRRSGLSTSNVIIIILLFLIAFVLINWYCIKVFDVDIIDFFVNLARSPPNIGGT